MPYVDIDYRSAPKPVTTQDHVIEVTVLEFVGQPIRCNWYSVELVPTLEHLYCGSLVRATFDVVGVWDTAPRRVALKLYFTMRASSVTTVSRQRKPRMVLERAEARVLPESVVACVEVSNVEFYYPVVMYAS